jgi:hypothetical protein
MCCSQFHVAVAAIRPLQQLRRSPLRLGLADADKASEIGTGRAAQRVQDAAVLEAAEIRLQAKRAKTQTRSKLSVVSRNNRATSRD